MGEKRGDKKEFAQRLMSLVGMNNIYIFDAFGDVGSSGSTLQQVPFEADNLFVGPAMSEEFEKLAEILEIAQTSGMAGLLMGSGLKVDAKLPPLKALLPYITKALMLGSGLTKVLDDDSTLLEELKAINPEIFVDWDGYTDDTRSDINEATINEYVNALDVFKKGDMLVANGTMGWMEHKKDGVETGLYAHGTEMMFNKLKELADRGVTIVVVGGDGSSMAKQYGLLDYDNVIVLIVNRTALTCFVSSSAQSFI